MHFSRIHSVQTEGLTTQTIDIEIDISKGTLHAFSIVGLADKAVEEARDRVGAAIKNSGFNSPKQQNHKVIISLAPADVKKEGPLFDLPIALAYLQASDEVIFDPEGRIFLGELSLDGTLRPVRGALPLTIGARKRGFTEIFLPHENVREAALIRGINVFPVRSLREIVDHLAANPKAGSHEGGIVPAAQTVMERSSGGEASGDMSDVRGQELAKRALEIAAAGGHNVALYGPPGTGKTMLARAFTTILPRLSYQAAVEVTGIHSLAGTLREGVITEPPFRAPHHTSSYVSVVGGGTLPKPGEVTLAHRGVLFLDEFPEFDRRVVEALRQPLEDKAVSISRSKGSQLFPANFILIAAMNPCPCGNYGTSRSCTCSPGSLDKYRRKLSGPIVDRIDLWVHVDTIDHEDLRRAPRGEKSEVIRGRVQRAREHQLERFKNAPHLRTNSDMRSRDIDELAAIENAASHRLADAARALVLSPRSYHRTLKVARTIADLASSETIGEQHILEAIGFRHRSE